MTEQQRHPKEDVMKPEITKSEARVILWLCDTSGLDFNEYIPSPTRAILDSAIKKLKMIGE
jgi:hypothetical protein